MARSLRPLIEDGIYHVFNRGNALQPIFERRDQRALFLRILDRVCERCDWSCLAFCLMGNHYHLVIRTPIPNISSGMRELGSSYAQAFNQDREMPGPVFQGRFKAKLIQSDAYLLAALRYLALNPVEAGLCGRPEEWRWSAHNAILGLDEPGVVDVRQTLALLDEDPRRARTIYRCAIAHPADPVAPEALGGIIVGDRTFAGIALAQSVRSPEMPMRQRLADRPELAALLAGDRDEGLLAAYVDHGYSQREIAEQLGCHYSTISRWIRDARMRQRKT
jgi:REP element-mobilizing transposase RayT